VALLYRGRNYAAQMAPKPPKCSERPRSRGAPLSRRITPRDGPPTPPNVRSAPAEAVALLYRGGNYGAPRWPPKPPKCSERPAEPWAPLCGGNYAPEMAPKPPKCSEPGGAGRSLSRRELRARDGPQPPKRSERPGGAVAVSTRLEYGAPRWPPNPPSVRSAPAEPGRSSIAAGITRPEMAPKPPKCSERPRRSRGVLYRGGNYAARDAPQTVVSVGLTTWASQARRLDVTRRMRQSIAATDPTTVPGPTGQVSSTTLQPVWGAISGRVIPRDRGAPRLRRGAPNTGGFGGHLGAA